MRTKRIVIYGKREVLAGLSAQARRLKLVQIADVTERGANVMYEVGLAHAFGREPLLLWRGPKTYLNDTKRGARSR